ncbi:MAG: UTP--glucose-1-phosphate uridylyltransferase [Spirochaetales bacterium]|nr:UTP--glucose-1-phosphate uridylyltransferase [Spirochaetales bacterium]
MGMTQAKGLLTAKSGPHFIDITLRQHQTLTVAVPVIFMNSFNTNQETCQALSRIQKTRTWNGARPSTAMFTRPFTPAECCRNCSIRDMSSSK